MKLSSISYSTVLHEIDGPSVSQNQIINITPGEGKILVFFNSEPYWEALAFPKEYVTSKNHFNETRVVRITPTRYVNPRL